jgi:protein-S-isoprenylcysteine O-methyltransferase Ste14
MSIKGIIFILLSFLIFLRFRKGIFAFREHEPYMFAAAQGLLVLLFINGGVLLENPFTPRRIFSWSLLLVSAAMAMAGFYGLRRHGQAVQNWENTTRLVRKGVFRYIRHPLYASLMVLATGILSNDLSWRAAAACTFTLCFLVAASRVEEGKNAAKFGEEYQRYQGETKRYFPFIV